MRKTMSVARKEFRSFFASPAAYLFLGAFIVATLFIFFWGETFFARNIVDIRPLFEWLPLVLIFLIAALTMRSWSEERRSGTLESLMTAPVAPSSLIVGKLLGGLALLVLAMALTLPLPITVSMLGPLDWGPVIGGYIATLFLGVAYLSIGLCTSSQTDNPIIALILTTLICGVFYVIGAPVITDLFGYQVAHFLEQLGTGSRFDSITRGVLDFRDLLYYATIAGVFLVLNRLALERFRWAGNPGNVRHRAWTWGAILAVANLVVLNVWFAPITALRADLTEGNRYSLSETTSQTLNQLQEPLVIRGYFSEKTHPQLAPLVPRLRDLIREYGVVAGDNVKIRFVDPTKNREAEKKAASRYGVKPVPFQTSSRYQSSVVNSYFDVVVSYGGQHEKLGFRELIDVQSGGGRELSVSLNNPEYELTRTIRKLKGQYAAGGDLFSGLAEPLTLNAYISPSQQLPESLRALESDLKSLVKELEERSNGKFSGKIQRPDDAMAQRLKQQMNLAPKVASLGDPDPFWFHLMLNRGDEQVAVQLPSTLDKAALKRNIESAVKRITPGMLDTVTLVTPDSGQGRRFRRAPGGPSFSQLKETLKENVRVETDNLKSGRVPPQTDLLMVLAPDTLNRKQLFAIDQFLMRGGRVVMTTSPYQVQIGRSLSASKHESGVGDWLKHHGLNVGDALVMDPNSAVLPVPVTRRVRGQTFREVQVLPYPFAPDIRDNGINNESPITTSLDQMTVPWGSPISVNEKKNQGRTVTTLLESSAQSWTRNGTDVLPDFSRYPERGFKTREPEGRQVMAVAAKGEFKSFFADKPSPLAGDSGASNQKQGSGTDGKSPDKQETSSASSFTSVIDSSPASSRFVLIGSNNFATDTSLKLISQALGSAYRRPVELLQNAADWSLEDPALLALRGRNHSARSLPPLGQDEKRFWEYLNYGLAAAGLLLIWFWRRQVRKRDRKYYQKVLAEV